MARAFWYSKALNFVIRYRQVSVLFPFQVFISTVEADMAFLTGLDNSNQSIDMGGEQCR